MKAPPGDHDFFDDQFMKKNDKNRMDSYGSVTVFGFDICQKNV